MRYILFIFFLCATTALSYSNDNIGTYQISEIYDNVDFNYNAIKNIDSWSVPYPKDAQFQIAHLKLIKGKYRIIKFIHVEYGSVSYSDKPVLIHKVFMIKVDKNKIIHDGYSFTLEWNDSPSYNLYKIQDKLKKLETTPIQFNMNNPYNESTKIEVILDSYFQQKKLF